MYQYKLSVKQTIMDIIIHMEEVSKFEKKCLYKFCTRKLYQEIKEIMNNCKIIKGQTYCTIQLSLFMKSVGTISMAKRLLRHIIP